MSWNFESVGKAKAVIQKVAAYVPYGDAEQWERVRELLIGELGQFTPEQGVYVKASGHTQTGTGHNYRTLNLELRNVEIAEEEDPEPSGVILPSPDNADNGDDGGDDDGEGAGTDGVVLVSPDNASGDENGGKG
jgi:hypothetical protein